MYIHELSIQALATRYYALAKSNYAVRGDSKLSLREVLIAPLQQALGEIKGISFPFYLTRSFIRPSAFRLEKRLGGSHKSSQKQMIDPSNIAP
jgi:hypothetical protein